MPDLSNNSFIPKRGPVRRSRRAVSRQAYMFTLISYVLLFATLLSAGGVFLYNKYLDQQLDEEIVTLNTAINSFSEADMQRVLEFDRRLQQADGRLDKSVSMVSVFEALEAATIDTVKIKSLSLEREEDAKLVLSATIETDTFDSTIFQRGVFRRNQVVDTVTFKEVQNSLVETGASEGGQSTGSLVPLVTFEAELEVPLSSVPYTVRRAQTPSNVTTAPAASEVTDSVDNGETI